MMYYIKEGGGRGGGGAGFSSPMDMFNMMFGGGMGGKYIFFIQEQCLFSRDCFIFHIVFISA